MAHKNACGSLSEHGQSSAELVDVQLKFRWFLWKICGRNWENCCEMSQEPSGENFGDS